MEPGQLDKERDGGAWRWWLLAVLIALVVFITAPPGATAATAATLQRAATLVAARAVPGVSRHAFSFLTMSEFDRTFGVNGNDGMDGDWDIHPLATGGAVKGGTFHFGVRDLALRA
jgi:hypothetical protein